MGGGGLDVDASRKDDDEESDTKMTGQPSAGNKPDPKATVGEDPSSAPDAKA